MRIVFTLLFILAAVSLATAQNVAPSCPTIKVTGPSRITAPGDTMTFTAEVVFVGEELPVTYEWTVNSGRIVKGQGTVVVEVADGDPGTNVTATVAVRGLPRHCSGYASDSGPMNVIIEGSPVDEWDDIPDDDQRARLDSFFIDLKDNPTSHGFIEIYVDAEKARRSGVRVVKFIVEHAKLRSFDTSRLVFGVKESTFNSVRLWRVPRGAANPNCDNCIVYNGRDL